MIMAFTVDTRAALVFAVTIPVLFAVILALLIVCIPLYKRVQSALDRVLSSTRENLAGVRVIRAFCKENDEIEAFSLRHGALTRLQLHGAAGNLAESRNHSGESGDGKAGCHGRGDRRGGKSIP